MSDELPPDQRRAGFPFLPVLLAGAGSALAAVLLSRLGLVGTVIGAALTPIIIITVQELGQRPVQRVAAVSRVARDGVVQGPVTRLRVWERIRWRRVLVLATAAFALTVATFTAVELVLDRPVATDRRSGILGTRPSSDPPPAGTTADEPDEDRTTPTPTAETGTAPTTTAETDPGTTATGPGGTTTTEPDGTTGATGTTGTTPATTAPEETATTESTPVGPAATTETTATAETTP